VQELPPLARRSGLLPWNPAWVGAALSGDDHLEVVQFDVTDPATWSATFAGAERMFLDDVRRLTGRPPGTWGASPATTHRLAASHRGRSLSGWRNRRGPSARKRPVAGAVPGVACPRRGPEVAFKQGHSTLPPTRPSPDNLAWNWLRME
jgi:hypothetical protein